MIGRTPGSVLRRRPRRMLFVWMRPLLAPPVRDEDQIARHIRWQASRAQIKSAPALRAKPGGRAKRGRPIGDRVAKSAELIEAARYVIAREGYAGASLRKVAARAGCSTGAVTYYSANKEAMVATVAEALFDEFDGWLDHQSSSIDLRAIFDRMIDWTAS